MRLSALSQVSFSVAGPHGSVLACYSVSLETLMFDYFAPIFFFPVYLFLEGGGGVISQLGGLVFPSSFKIFVLYSGITHNLLDPRSTCVCAGSLMRRKRGRSLG